MRRHPDIRWLRRPGDVERLVDLQRRMLDALWPLVAPDGILVYTTCSLLRVENDEQARAFLERHGDARPIEPIESPATPADPGRRLLPGDLDCDGFYYFAARRMRQ
jgi:16S rRNA (cytosine967-C5)-methyltransferase